MGDIKGFINIARKTPSSRSPKIRLKDYKEIYQPASDSENKEQAARCMDCGVPFCHSGCPLGNLIPNFNDAVYAGDWQRAYELLSATNNFPEFTGRICPAPCEGSCVLGINNDAVTIEFIEKAIIEKAFENKWVRGKSVIANGKKVAIIGSGPSGLAAADQLNKAGYTVTVFEKEDKIGGLLRYGIPDFKLDKSLIDRRLEVMSASGISFIANSWVGHNLSVERLRKTYDALLLCCGSNVPRDINIEGREATGIHFAMDFLTSSNKFVAGLIEKPEIDVKNKNVVVIGGGDTGADCVGTSNRQGAKSVTQLELMSIPAISRTDNNPWPEWPLILRTSTSHEEGCNREWAISTTNFTKDSSGKVTGLNTINVEWKKNAETGKYGFENILGTENWIAADAIFIACGFLHTSPSGLVNQLGLETDNRGNIKTKNFHTSVENIFSSGDMRRGQSLVVWAISEGREAAIVIDKHISKSNYSSLTSKDHGALAM